MACEILPAAKSGTAIMSIFVNFLKKCIKPFLSNEIAIEILEKHHDDSYIYRKWNVEV